MRSFTITTLSKEVLYSSSNPSSVRFFLEGWKARRYDELLLIYSLTSCSFSAIESYLDPSGGILVYRAMFSPTIENLMVEGKHLEAVTKAVQALEIISSDMSEYETLLLIVAPTMVTKANILKGARRRQVKLIKLLTGFNNVCDEDFDEDVEDDD